MEAQLIQCYSPGYGMMVGHWGDNNELLVQTTAEANPHLVYFFTDL